MNFRDDIQGLRAIAVILVFIFHLSASALPGGFIGVDMFFVISGYLVTAIVYSKVNKKTFSLIDFYRSRIQRIVPAYLFMILFTSIIVPFLFVNSDAVLYRKALFRTLLFNSNNYFASLDSYFGTGSNENPLLHTWTLAVEMQFYFILPIILMLFRNRKLLLSILSMMTIVLFVYSSYNVFNGNAGLMYFSLPSRIPEFMLGAIAAVAKLEDFNFIKRNSNFLSIIGIITIIASAIFMSESTPFPGVTSLIPCLATLSLLMTSSSKLSNFLSSRYLTFIGEMSYSLYLWHWPIMALFRYYKNEYEFTGVEKVLVILITVGLSIFSYYFVEKKLRQAKGKSFFIPFFAMVATSVAMLFLVPKINSRFFGSQLEYFTPSFGLGSHGATFKRVEIFGDTTALNNILLIGDSHALCMKKYMDVIGDKNRFSVKTVTNNIYPTLPGITEEQFTHKGVFGTYNHLVEYVNQEIPKVNFIVLQFTGDGKKWAGGLKTLLLKMRPDQRLIVLQDFPISDKNPVRINRDIVKRTDVSQEYVVKKEKLSSDILKIIQSDKRCKYVDLTNSPVFDNVPFYRDTLMYYDRTHLNVYGSRVYAEETEKKFLEALGLAK